MQHSLHTNYQTSFRIQRKDDQTYYDVIHSIYQWLIKKKRERGLVDNWKQFSFKGDWDRCAGTNSRIQTATCLEDSNVRSWAMEFVHPDSQLGPKRFWHTHVGLRDSGEDLVISVRVAYSWNNEDLTVEAESPSPTVPAFVRGLIQKFVAYSGRKDFRLIEAPLPLGKPGHGKLIRDFVFSPDRRYPLIVFNGDHEAHRNEADRLAKELTGKAQVVVMATNLALGEEMKSAFPYDFHIGFKRMRVFFPMASGPKIAVRHRWYDIASTEYEEQRAGILHGLLRNHNLFEKQAVESISDIHRLISKSRISKLSESASGASEEEIQNLYQGYIKDIEKERDEAKLEAEDYAQQIDELEAAVQNLEWKCKSFEGRRTSDSSVDIRRAVFSLPENLHDVVKIATELHSDRLIFTQEAFDSAEESRACELIGDAWLIISHMATTLYDLKFSGCEIGDLAKKFQDQAGYEYARSEGPKTKQDGKLSRLRKITHDGKNYEIWAHIKKGNEGTKQIRIYFDFDNELKKIIVSYVGLHMENSSSRGRK